MADSRVLTAIQKKNCGGKDTDAFLMVVRPPPKKTGFNPFASQKQCDWAMAEVKRVCARLLAEVKQITFMKKSYDNGNGFFCSGILIWFNPGMHPKAVKKMMKGKTLNITWNIHVRKNHDSEKYGEPITEWEWRFVPAKFEPMTKEEIRARRKKKVQDLVLSDDSDSDDEEGF